MVLNTRDGPPLESFTSRVPSGVRSMKCRDSGNFPVQPLEVILLAMLVGQRQLQDMEVRKPFYRRVLPPPVAEIPERNPIYALSGTRIGALQLDPMKQQ